MCPLGGLLALADDLGDLGADAVERDPPQRLQGLRGDALTLVDESEQDVLGADVVVVEHPCLFLSKDDHPTGSVGESLEHVLLPHERRYLHPRRIDGYSLTATTLCAPNSPTPPR